MPNTLLRLHTGRSAVVLIDYQQRLLPAIHDHERVLRRAGFIAGVAAELGVPVIGTAQSPDRLGVNDPLVGTHMDEVIEKTAFGACEAGVADALARLDDARGGERLEAVVAGVEAHVCLAQTALGLIETGRRVWIVADASGSRHQHDRDAAIARLRDAGARIVTAEMVAFEWLGTAGHESFKTVSRMVKNL